MRAGGWPLAVRFSPPLEEILHRMDVESDNYLAEMVLKNLGAVVARQGTTGAGASVVRAILAERKIPLAGVRIADGSGLSSLDRLTPKALVTILQRIWADRDLRPVVLRILPVAGRDGTLRDRMRSAPARGNVRAKTGTLDNASALSGFVRDRYAFSILVNAPRLSSYAARAAQDRFATVLAGAVRLGQCGTTDALTPGASGAPPRPGARTPSFWAFVSFDAPGSSPTTRPVVFFETEPVTFAPFASSAACASSRVIDSSVPVIT